MGITKDCYDKNCRIEGVTLRCSIELEERSKAEHDYKTMIYKSFRYPVVCVRYSKVLNINRKIFLNFILQNLTVSGR